GVLLEGGDQLDGVPGVVGRGRELLVDHVDLARMDGDLAREAHGHAVPALAAQAVEVADVGVHRVDGLDAGRRRGHRAHHAGVAGDVEGTPPGVARARQGPPPRPGPAPPPDPAPTRAGRGAV